MMGIVERLESNYFLPLSDISPVGNAASLANLYQAKQVLGS